MHTARTKSQKKYKRREMGKKEIKRFKPFKKAHVYDSREEARKDIVGPEEAKDKLADTRMKAQELGRKIHEQAKSTQ